MSYNNNLKDKSFLQKKTSKQISEETNVKNVNKQLENCICKIYNNNKSNFVYGFLCKIPFPDKFNLLPVLIANNNILNQDDILKNITIKITFENDKVIKYININNNQERKTYYSKQYDLSIIEIFPEKDNLNNFLEFNDDYIHNEEKIKNSSIYIPYYSEEDELNISYGSINNINEFIIEHNIKEGCIGGPIILLDISKVVGINKGKKEDNFELSYGNLLKNSIIEFNEKFEIKNEIFLKIRITDEDVNKDVYILNYPYYLNTDGIKRKYEGLRELNSSNTFMFINNEKCEFDKKKKFEKKGIYTIKLKFNFYLTDAFVMFMGCKNIIEIDLSSFNSKNITNMAAMFRDCINLTNINFSNFITKNVTIMNSMFFGCKNLINIEFFTFDTQNVIDMSSMFNECTSLKNLDLSSFNTENVTSMNMMFNECTNLVSINLSSFITKNVTNMAFMFNKCINLQKIDLSSFDTRNVTNMNSMFSDCNNLKNIDLSSFQPKNVLNMGCMFYQCKNLEFLNLSTFYTPKLKNISGMFYNCHNLKYIDLSNFFTDNITLMYSLFYGCNSLISLDLSSFKTHNTTNMNSMFYNCNNLTKINLSSFDTQKVENMACMFLGCKNLTYLNLSSFNTSNVKTVNGMFYNCNNLIDINLSSFVISNLINDNFIFNNCNNLSKFTIKKYYQSKAPFFPLYLDNYPELN